MNYGINFLWRTWVRKIKEKQAIRESKKKYVTLKKESLKKLFSINHCEIPVNTNEIRLFAIMRNEGLRLPYFFEYYKNLKVDRFFIIDNNSTDGSLNIIKNEKNLHLFSTNDNYKNHWCWMEHLLEHYGKDHWCLVVDIDELFSYPNIENINLRNLTAFLDLESSTSIRSFLLDMYSGNFVDKTLYTPGEDPLLSTPYFDKDFNTITFPFFDRQSWQSFTFPSFSGGMRDRVFGKTSLPHILSKVSLFKNIKGTYLTQGMHAINGSKVSEIQGVVFHTKFLYDFIDEVKEESVRQQHFSGAFYYKHFNETLNKTSQISFFNKNSIKFIDSNQLTTLGVTKTSSLFENFCKKLVQ